MFFYIAVASSLQLIFVWYNNVEIRPGIDCYKCVKFQAKNVQTQQKMLLE